jgi:hypothetical protein
MKTNYDFPYKFLNLISSSISYLKIGVKDSHLELTIDLDNYNFNEQVDIVLEVENTQTFYRKLFVLSENNSTININFEHLGSKAMYAIYLVSKIDGEIEINGESDYYEYGDCIGVLEKNSIIYQEENGFSGLIKIAPTEKDNIAYDLTSDWITIELPLKTYEKFYPWQKDDSTIPFALASLGNSCIQFAIFQALNQNHFKEYKWWEFIAKMLEDNGYTVEEMEVDDIPGATNKILGNCIQEMVNAAVPDVDHGDTSILS